MAELKTKPTKVDPSKFVNSIKDETRRNDAKALMALMRRATGLKPRMWGSSIVASGTYHYTYASGREGDWCVTGFSPRNKALTVYIMPGLHVQKGNLKKLGKVTTGKSCVYINKLADVHMPTLEKMVKQACVDIEKVAESMRKLRKKKISASRA